MKKIIKTLFLITTILSGCASGYKDFYQPANPTILEKVNQYRLNPPPQIPIVDRTAPSNDMAPIYDAYLRKGYVYIGSSSFTSGRAESESSAIQQGKNVGADLVLIINPKYLGSTTSVVPITTPTTSTSYSTGTATAYGSGGIVNAYGSGTTTTFGSVTNMVPITVHRLEYGAVYFVRQKPHFGVYVRDLNEQERKLLQTNKGSVIKLIIDESPAFKADLLSGDIITSINDIQIETGQSFLNLIGSIHDESVKVNIIRDGKQSTKTVLLTN